MDILSKLFAPMFVFPGNSFVAGACEGWACAAMSLLYDGLTSSSLMYRVASMTPTQLRDIGSTGHLSLGAAISVATTFQHNLGYVSPPFARSSHLSIDALQSIIRTPKAPF